MPGTTGAPVATGTASVGVPAADARPVGRALVEVHVTTPDAETANRLAHLLVEERLAACVQVLPGVTSVYRWQGAVETSHEHLLLAKTTAAAFPPLRDRIGAEHPYETPEIVALPIADATAGYAAWVTAEVDSGRTPAPPHTRGDDA